MSFDEVFQYVDSIVSLVISLFILVGFIRGDLLSRKSTEEIVAHTVREVIDQLDIKPNNN